MKRDTQFYIHWKVKVT